MVETLWQIDEAYRSGGNIPLVLIASFFLFILGSVVASFSGLVAARLGDADEEQLLLKSISYPPSYCESCNKPLDKLSLIPVLGWLVRRGRCSCCHYTVPVKYPIMEAGLGIISAIIPFLMGDFGIFTFSALIILWVGSLISWVDWEHQIIPEELTWFLLFFGLLFSPFEMDLYAKVFGAAMCCVAIWASFTVVGLIKGLNTHSGGDVALATAAGAWVGIAGVPTFLLISSIVYVAYSTPLRLKGIIWVPMGPALALGLFISIFVPPLSLLLSGL